MLLDPLKEALDLTEGEAWYLICLLAALPLSLFYRYVRNTQLRHLYSLSLGLLYSALVFRYETFHLLIMIIVTYLVMLVAPRRYSAQICFVINMGYLFAGHVDTVVNHYMEFALNWTAAGMMLVVKLTSAAYEFADGRLEKEFFEKLHPDQQDRAFKELPSIFVWLSYAFFYPTLLCGPPVGVKDYMAFGDSSMFDKEPGKAPPSPWTFECLGTRFLFCVMALVWHFAHAKFNVDFTVTDEFASHYTLIQRVLYISLATNLSFEHYFFGWFNADAACAIAGISYNGREAGKVRWDRVSMIGSKFWTGNDGTVIARNWNVQGAKWLRHTVYWRIIDYKTSSTSARNYAQIATYAVSAAWHGLYAGFYLSFFSFAYVTIVSRVMRANMRHFFYERDPQTRKETPKRFYQVYEVASWFACFLTFYYCAMPFKLMSVERTLKAWGATYYFFHTLSAVVLVFFLLTGSFWQSFKPKSKKV